MAASYEFYMASLCRGLPPRRTISSGSRGINGVLVHVKNFKGIAGSLSAVPVFFLRATVSIGTTRVPIGLPASIASIISNGGFPLSLELGGLIRPISCDRCRPPAA